MRLLSLDISNFRVIRRAALEFPENVIGIIGPNGSGKSSIVEAIAWALYGNQAARSGRDEVKATYARAADTCEVALAFMIGEERYRVVRRLVGKTERPEVELFRGDSSESVGNIETRQYMAQLLGLDWRGFLTSFLARQAELNALSDLQPAKRREHLAGMLGIERLDRAMAQVKDDTRLNREKAEFIRRQLAEKTLVEARLAALREHVQELTRQRETVQGAYDSASRDLAAITARHREQTDKKEACSRLQAAIDAERRTIALLARQAAGLKLEHETLEGSGQEASLLAEQLAGYDQVRAEVEQLKDAKRRREFNEHLRSQLVELQRALEKAAEESAAAATEEREIADALGGISPEIDRQKTSAERDLEKAREAYTDARAKKEALLAELSRLRLQIEQIKSIGPDTVCDRCHRPFGNDLPMIRKHLDDELGRLALNLDEADRQLAAIRADGEKLKQHSSDVAAQATKRQELAIRREAMLKRLADGETKTRSLAEQIAEVRRQSAESGEIAFDNDRLTAMTARLVELDRKRTRLDQLSGQLGRLPAVENQMRETAEKLAQGNETAQRLQDELSATGYDAAVYEEVTAAFSEAQTALESRKTALLEVSKELDIELREIELKQEQMARFAEAEKELEQCATGEFYGEKLGRLFADFRKQVIASIRPRLAELTSGLFAEMTDGKYSLVDLDEDYNIQIMDYGQFFGIERFSGGEKDLANLCLRLAISLALTESAGLAGSFVILDEVFGSQDESRRDLIFHGLVNLKNRFRQVLLITHIEEIKHKVETLMQVEPVSGGWSEVRVNGQTV